MGNNQLSFLLLVGHGAKVVSVYVSEMLSIQLVTGKFYIYTMYKMVVSKVKVFLTAKKMFFQFLFCFLK